jgi:hypothetical protein
MPGCQKSRFQLVNLLLVTLALASTGAAAVQRAFVSAATGLDTNTAFNCDAIHPCRFFQAAMTVTDTNGEVVVLDSGGYGAVTITQSLSLIAPPGVYGGISVFPNASGITISTDGVVVQLRGLTINGQGGSKGIKVMAAAQLTVENCVVAGMEGAGIYVTGPVNLRVSDTTIRDSGSGLIVEDGVQGYVTRSTISGNSDYGVSVYGSLDDVSTVLEISDTTIDGNIGGVRVLADSATSSLDVSIHESRVVRNINDFGIPGILVYSSNGGMASLIASNNLISKNTAGIFADQLGARVWASGNTVTDNTGVGLLNAGTAVFESAGNNSVRNNGTDVSDGVTLVGTR